MHGAGRKYGEYRSTYHTAIESIFGSFVNSKTEDTVQKIVLRLSELVVKAIDNSRRTDVEDAPVKADGKSKIGTMNVKTLVQLRNRLRLQLRLECDLSYNPRMGKPFLTPEVSFW